MFLADVFFISLRLSFEQKMCFQLVMASDYRTGRSYIMFKYGYHNWGYQPIAAQGYQDYQDVSTREILGTSYSFLSYWLPWIRGNTRKNMKNYMILL